jgi:Protein of unknown function (DUF2971).
MDDISIYNELIETLTESYQYPEALFHYTTAAGLIGILTMKALYATHLEFMNDMHELQYGKDIISNEVERYSASREEIVKDILGYVRKKILEWKASDSHSFKDAFAVCFCEEGNILSQWRAYGASGGFSIGWDSFALQRAAEEMNGQLLKVIYDEIDQISIISKLCAQAERVITKYQDVLTESMRQKENAIGKIGFPDYLVSIFYMYALRFKRPDFREEREWRLVFHEELFPNLTEDIKANDGIHFRERRGHISPYYEFNLDSAFSKSLDNSDLVPFPIREIVVGPSSDADMNAKAVRALLGRMTPRANFYVNFSKSNIPLRW